MNEFILTVFIPAIILSIIRSIALHNAHKGRIFMTSLYETVYVFGLMIVGMYLFKALKL